MTFASSLHDICFWYDETHAFFEGDKHFNFEIEASAVNIEAGEA
jgi:hypothetical protein